MLLIMLNCFVINDDDTAISYGWHTVDHLTFSPSASSLSQSTLYDNGLERA